MNVARLHGSTSQADFSATLLDADRPCPEGLCAWNGSDPTRRLAVHRNNVVSSLIDALADTFPVTQELVGPEFFRAMAAVFVRQAPPRSRVLAQYGQDLPAFIGRFEPARSLPYLADVARLEAARVRAYHAADAEPVAGAAVSLALASGERIGELRLVLHPSVSALASAHAVVSVWAAHQGAGRLEHVRLDEPEDAIVVRQGLDVVVLLAPPGAAAFVAAVHSGRAFSDAAAMAAEAAPAFDLAAVLPLLLGHGGLNSIHLPQRQLS
jgi:hypothetical protein